MQSKGAFELAPTRHHLLLNLVVLLYNDVKINGDLVISRLLFITKHKLWLTSNDLEGVHERPLLQECVGTLLRDFRVEFERDFLFYFLGASFLDLAATIHFSPFTCCFHWFFRHSIMAFPRNENHTITLIFTIHYVNSRANGSLFTPITFTDSPENSLQESNLRKLEKAARVSRISSGLPVVGVSRGNRIRGNKTERFWEGNLPLRGSLRGSLRGRVSEVFRGFERFSEGLRGFQRFSEVFQRPSQRPSQSAIFLSELRVVLPLIVLPLKTPAILRKIPAEGRQKFGERFSRILPNAWISMISGARKDKPAVNLGLRRRCAAPYPNLRRCAFEIDTSCLPSRVCVSFIVVAY